MQARVGRGTFCVGGTPFWGVLRGCLLAFYYVKCV